jgi:hypothetical protein
MSTQRESDPSRYVLPNPDPLASCRQAVTKAAPDTGACSRQASLAKEDSEGHDTKPLAQAQGVGPPRGREPAVTHRQPRTQRTVGTAAQQPYRL